MPPRVAYWTSSFEPDMEAIASEVAVLRRRFSKSVVWGLSLRHWLLLSRRRGFCFHPRLHLLFRAATRILEPAFHLNHVFGSLGDWFYLQTIRKRPTVLTVTATQPPLPSAYLERVERFVVEHPGGEEPLRKLGIAAQRIRVILPPVDLQRFSPGPAPNDPFTVLFASSPEREDWLAGRGIPELLDTAGLRPKMRFRLLWRPWGNSQKRVEQWVNERGLPNVELIAGRRQDMAREYQQAHVTIVPFKNSEFCKPAPNSVVESLACGRPVLITEVVGFAGMISEEGGGLVSPVDSHALAENLDRLRTEWQSFAGAARRLAERYVGVDRFLESYEKLYEECLVKPATLL